MTNSIQLKEYYRKNNIKYITDGNVNSIIKQGESLPEGWHFGRTSSQKQLESARLAHTFVKNHSNRKGGRPRGSKNSYEIVSLLKGKTYEEIGRDPSPLRGKTHIEAWGETAANNWKESIREKAIERWSNQAFRQAVIPLLGPKTEEGKRNIAESTRCRLKGKTPYNKGLPSPFRGMTYEEISNSDRAKARKKKQSKARLKYYGSLAPSESRPGTLSEKWRRLVLKRGNNTCKRCGYYHIKGKGLHAHHIKPWSLFPVERFSVENGMILCSKPCHREIHEEINQAKLFIEQLKSLERRV